jgi:hypothetical protein
MDKPISASPVQVNGLPAFDITDSIGVLIGRVTDTIDNKDVETIIASVNRIDAAIAFAKDAIKLLDLIGKKSKCTACGRVIWFVPSKKGGAMPVTNEMKSHFADCPKAALYRKG